MFWRSSAGKTPPARSEKKKVEDPIQTFADRLKDVPPEIIIGSALLGAIGMKYCSKFYARYARRYPTIDWITPDVLSKKRWLKGRVVSCVPSLVCADNLTLLTTFCSV